MGSLAEQAQTQRMRELGGLEAIGAQKQQLAQTSADLSYQDFLAQRDYPFTQLERMVGVTGTPSATGQTQVNQSPAPSKASQIGGLLTSGIGILGATGAFGKGGWLGLKNGGKASAKKQKAKQAKTGLGWLKD
jgi:hypothetical protein